VPVSENETFDESLVSRLVSQYRPRDGFLPCTVFQPHRFENIAKHTSNPNRRAVHSVLHVTEVHVRTDLPDDSFELVHFRTPRRIESVELDPALIKGTVR